MRTEVEVGNINTGRRENIRRERNDEVEEMIQNKMTWRIKIQIR